MKIASATKKNLKLTVPTHVLFSFLCSSRCLRCHLLKWELQSLGTLSYAVSFGVSRAWADAVFSVTAMNLLKPLIYAFLNVNCSSIAMWGEKIGLHYWSNLEGIPRLMKVCAQRLKNPSQMDTFEIPGKTCDSDTEREQWCVSDTVSFLTPFSFLKGSDDQWCALDTLTMNFLWISH